MGHGITIRDGYGYEFGAFMSEELRDIHTGRLFPFFSFLFISMSFELSFDARGGLYLQSWRGLREAMIFFLFYYRWQSHFELFSTFNSKAILIWLMVYCTPTLVSERRA